MCDVATVQKIANCLGVSSGKVQLNEEQVYRKSAQHIHTLCE